MSRAAVLLKGQFFGTGAREHDLSRRHESRFASIRAMDVTAAFNVSKSTLRWIFSIAVLSLGAALVLQNKLSIGGMVASVVLLNRAFFPIIAFVGALSDLRDALENWRRIGKRFTENVRRPGLLRALPEVPLLKLRNVDLQGQLTIPRFLIKLI